jgi:hypothetical protein
VAVVLVVSMTVVHIVGVTAALHRLVSACAVMPVIVVLCVLLVLVHQDSVSHAT